MCFGNNFCSSSLYHKQLAVVLPSKIDFIGCDRWDNDRYKVMKYKLNYSNRKRYFPFTKFDYKLTECELGHD